MFMFKRSNTGLLLLASSAFLANCARAPLQPELSPEVLRDAACAPSAKVKSVEGTIWMNAKSADATGRFPAQVSAKENGPLRIEVTNLLGGTEAIITVDGLKYQIDTPEKKNGKKTVESGFGSWGGIPLSWAKTLFLGRIPCPPAGGASQEKLSMLPDGRLRIDVPASMAGAAQTFVFHFRRWLGQPWPDALEWEQRGALGAKVTFNFDDPEDRTAAPRKWEAKSDRGEVKVRWRDRSVN